VEGEDDEAIYRWLESHFGLPAGSVFPCGGRNVLINIYRQRARLVGKRIVWLADLDMWKFSAPPSDLSGIIFTSGYSIENDLYAGSEIELLLSTDERTRHTQLLDVVCNWFVFEILEHQAGRESQVGANIKKVFDLSNLAIREPFATSRQYVPPNPAFVDIVRKDYKLSLRGKTLIDVLFECVNYSKRPARHSKEAIVENCLKLYPNNPFIDRIMNEVRARL
jgi:hypothetical protein